eukprot:COSAG01_NODE_6281_length_3755_cov_5.597374_1_plen_210_part_00
MAYGRRSASHWLAAPAVWIEGDRTAVRPYGSATYSGDYGSVDGTVLRAVDLAIGTSSRQDRTSYLVPLASDVTSVICAHLPSPSPRRSSALRPQPRHGALLDVTAGGGAGLFGAVFTHACTVHTPYPPLPPSLSHPQPSTRGLTLSHIYRSNNSSGSRRGDGGTESSQIGAHTCAARRPHHTDARPQWRFFPGVLPNRVHTLRRASSCL